MLITIGVVAGEMKHRTNDSETMIKVAMIRLTATRSAGEQVRWSDRVR